jgi:acyl-CoA reductase-like NAD-dependent aldehyde dehydrogenase
MYVRADVDVKAAAESLADGAMYNTGQGCCSVERIYVHEAVQDAFIEHFVRTVQSMKGGDPMDATTYLGAITREPQIGVLQAQVADAVAKGAQLRTGGHRTSGPGWGPVPRFRTTMSKPGAAIASGIGSPTRSQERAARDCERGRSRS